MITRVSTCQDCDRHRPAVVTTTGSQAEHLLQLAHHEAATGHVNWATVQQVGA